MKRLLDRVYRIGLWIKGIDGVLEIAGGLFLLLVGQPQLGQLITFLTQRELTEDPRDWIASHVRDAVNHLSPSTQLFASLYLLSHGVVKLGLMVELLRKRTWAYPYAIAFLLVFLAYQVYRLRLQFSLALLLISVLDAVIVLFVWRDYRQVVDTSSKRSISL
ncbi:MAG TPA: DUF2127 domain-containing protein [Gemmatimonadales bacterium]|nr:DUF2127 domain-containing protein [Gemmatimonadales bacterium]